MRAGRVAVLGLGEAGRLLAADLVQAGVEVHGYDPYAGDEATVSVRASDPESAVDRCDIVLSVNTAKVAVAVAKAAVSAMSEGALYADLNTASPATKRELAAIARSAGVRFADVALLGPVTARGLATPALASGDGARPFAEALAPLGMPVEVVSDEAGVAATLKLLRSVFMKGLAASALESLRAGQAAGCREWLEGQIAEVIGRPLLDRLVQGSYQHAARRADEMEAARELLLDLEVEPRVVAAAASLLAEIAATASVTVPEADGVG